MEPLLFKFRRSPTSGKSSCEWGFSLIEILIGMVLLSFLMLGVYSLVDNSSRSIEESLKTDGDWLVAETALGRFEWDFSQIYSPLYFSRKWDAELQRLRLGLAPQTTPVSGALKDAPGRGGQASDELPADQETSNSSKTIAIPNPQYSDNPRFDSVNTEGLPIPLMANPQRDTFEFLTAGNRRHIANSKQSHFAWVKYTLRRSEDPDSGQELIRYFSPFAPYFREREETMEAKPQVLLSHVISLKFVFWDPAKEKWLDTLKEIGESNPLRAVKIILTWKPDGIREETVERAFLPLWPYFEPEDLKKFYKQKTATTPQTKGVGAPPPEEGLLE